MAERILPIELGWKSLALVERLHQTVNPSGLPTRIATKRNAVAIALLPEAFVVLQAATASFKTRMFCWVVAAIALCLSLWLAWWIIFLGGLSIASERVVASKERRLWILLAAMLLSAEILASDFAGWGTAYPAARRSAVAALEFDNETGTEWLDYYLPRRAFLEEDVVRAFGPAG